MHIDEIEMLAPVIAAQLLSAIYAHAALLPQDQPLKDRMDKSMTEVLYMWGELSDLIQTRRKDGTSGNAQTAP